MNIECRGAEEKHVPLGNNAVALDYVRNGMNYCKENAELIYNYAAIN